MTASDPAPQAARATHRLEGLEPDNLLAVLALLGLLRALEAARADAWRPRVFWDGLPARPVLVLAEPATEHEIATAAAEGCGILAAGYAFDGRDMADFTPAEMRKLMEQGLEAESEPARAVADVLSAIGHESGSLTKSVKKKGKLARGTFNCLDMAKVAFLKSLEIATTPTPRDHERIADGIFRPWKRQTRFTTFRWDWSEHRRHAYRFTAPTNDPVKTEPGAITLAAFGLPALPGTVVARRGAIQYLNIGTELAPWPGGRFVTWPIWDRPASLATIQALIAHPAVASTTALTPALRRLGIVEVRRCRRIPNGDYANFTRAEAV